MATEVARWPPRAGQARAVRQLERTLGPDATGALMELLPPVGWAVATTQDLDAVGHPVGAQMSELGFEMADLRAEMATGLVWAVVTLAQ